MCQVIIFPDEREAIGEAKQNLPALTFLAVGVPCSLELPARAPAEARGEAGGRRRRKQHMGVGVVGCLLPFVFVLPFFVLFLQRLPEGNLFCQSPQSPHICCCHRGQWQSFRKANIPEERHHEVFM